MEILQNSHCGKSVSIVAGATLDGRLQPLHGSDERLLRLLVPPLLRRLLLRLQQHRGEDHHRTRIARGLRRARGGARATRKHMWSWGSNPRLLN